MSDERLRRKRSAHRQELAPFSAFGGTRKYRSSLILGGYEFCDLGALRAESE